MTKAQDASAIERKIWNVGNNYRGKLELELLVKIWVDIIYLYEVRGEYSALLETNTSDVDSLIGKLRDVAKSNDIQIAVVNDLEECLQRTLLSRTSNENLLQVFNEIREDGINLIHEQGDRVTLMQVLQRMNIDFGPQMNRRNATPNGINMLMARIIGTHYSGNRQLTVYDPTSGTGGSLIAMSAVLTESNDLKLIGQEINTQMYIFSSMMLDLIDDSRTSHVLINGDALNHDENFNKLKADIVITDPPYAYKWNPSDGLLDSGPYANIGALPPKSKADFAFVIHGLSHLSEDGIMVIQLPHGVLFRGAAEAKIRKYLVEENYIDAVIGLPANAQFEMSIPTTLLVLRKNRTLEDVLFVDASDEFEKSHSKNVIPESSIDTIVETYNSFKDVKHYSHVASRSEIIENDFNLNIPRYVDTFTPPEAVPIPTLDRQISNIGVEVRTLGTRAQKIMVKYRTE